MRSGVDFVRCEDDVVAVRSVRPAVRTDFIVQVVSGIAVREESRVSIFMLNRSSERCFGIAAKCGQESFHIITRRSLYVPISFWRRDVTEVDDLVPADGQIALGLGLNETGIEGVAPLQ